MPAAGGKGPVVPVLAWGSAPCCGRLPGLHCDKYHSGLLG